jgi:hypothetical protein
MNMVCKQTVVCLLLASQAPLAGAQEAMARMDIMLDMLIEATGGEERLVQSYLDGCEEVGRLDAALKAVDLLKSSGAQLDPALRARMDAILQLRSAHAEIVPAQEAVERGWAPLDIDECSVRRDTAASDLTAALSQRDPEILRARLLAGSGAIDQEKLMVGGHIAAMLAAGLATAAAN